MSVLKDYQVCKCVAFCATASLKYISVYNKRTFGAPGFLFSGLKGSLVSFYGYIIFADRTVQCCHCLQTELCNVAIVCRPNCAMLPLFADRTVQCCHYLGPNCTMLPLFADRTVQCCHYLENKLCNVAIICRPNCAMLPLFADRTVQCCHYLQTELCSVAIIFRPNCVVLPLFADRTVQCCHCYAAHNYQHAYSCWPLFTERCADKTTHRLCDFNFPPRCGPELAFFWTTQRVVVLFTDVSGQYWSRNQRSRIQGDLENGKVRLP